MARQRMMQRFARWHIWLGWLVGVPFLIWTVSGLIMAARPLAEVRGEHLRAPEAERTVDPASLVLPDVGEPIRSARLLARDDGSVWVVESREGALYVYSARDGRVVPPLAREDARAIADRAYAGDAAFASLAYFPAEEEPMELRRGRSSFRVEYEDGTRVYVDDVTGEVLALRTRWWRLFDFMYGLHIFDPENRSDSHHPVMIVFASLAVIGSLLGCTLLFRRRKARVKG